MSERYERAQKGWRRRGKVTAAEAANRAHARAVCPALYECTSRGRVCVRACARARLCVRAVLRTAAAGVTFMRPGERICRVVSNPYASDACVRDKWRASMNVLRISLHPAEIVKTNRLAPAATALLLSALAIFTGAENTRDRYTRKI